MRLAQWVSAIALITASSAPHLGAQVSDSGQVRMDRRSSVRPLFVLDGMPLDSTVLQTGKGEGINPDDIADVAVIKGSAAAAVLGPAAADGAVLITTKHSHMRCAYEESPHHAGRILCHLDPRSALFVINGSPLENGPASDSTRAPWCFDQRDLQRISLTPHPVPAADSTPPSQADVVAITLRDPPTQRCDPS